MATDRRIWCFLRTLPYLLLLGTFKLSDANTAPRFHSSGSTLSTAPVSETLPVNTGIYKVAAIDPDTGQDGNITFSIQHYAIPGAPEYLFGAIDIHPITGIIFVNKSLDFDSFPLAKSKVYTPTLYHKITVTDQGSPPKSASITFSLLLADSNDNAPQFVNVSKTVSVDDSASVGSKVLHLKDINVTDIDHGGNGETTLSLVVRNVSAEENPFNVTSTAVHLRKSLDFLKRSEYEFLLIATDNPTTGQALTSRTTLTLLVTTNRFIEPVFLPNASQTVALSEKLPVGSEVVRLLTQYFNPATRNQKVEYYFSQGAAVLGNTTHAGSFAIEAETGIITLVQKLDFEQTGEYYLEVVAIDPEDAAQNSTATITISVTDVNDNYPEVMSSPGIIRVKLDSISKGEEIYTLKCTDRDSGENGETVFIQIDSSNSSWLQITQNGTIIFNISRDEISGTGTELNESVDYMCCDGGQPQLCSNTSTFTLVLEPSPTTSTSLTITSPETPTPTPSVSSNRQPMEVKTSSSSVSSTATQERIMTRVTPSQFKTTFITRTTSSHQQSTTLNVQTTTSNSWNATLSSGTITSNSWTTTSNSQTTTSKSRTTTSNSSTTTSNSSTTTSNSSITTSNSWTTTPNSRTTTLNGPSTTLPIHSTTSNGWTPTLNGVSRTLNEQSTTLNGQSRTSNEQRRTLSEQSTTSNEQSTTSSEQRTTSNEQNEQIPTSNKQSTTSNEQRTTSNEQSTTSNEQIPTSNKQRTTSNEQSETLSTTSNERSTTQSGQNTTSDKEIGSPKQTTKRQVTTSEMLNPFTSSYQSSEYTPTAAASSTLPLKAASIIAGAVALPILLLILIKVVIICRRKRFKQMKRKISSVSSFPNKVPGSMSTSSTQSVLILNHEPRLTIDLPPVGEDRLSRQSLSNSEIQLATSRLASRRPSKVLDDQSCSNSPPSSSSPSSERSMPSDVEAQLRRGSMSIGSLGERAHGWGSLLSHSMNGHHSGSRTGSASLNSQCSRPMRNKERSLHFLPVGKASSQMLVAFQNSSRPQTAGGSTRIPLNDLALPNSAQPSDAVEWKSTSVLNSPASSRDDLLQSATGSVAAVRI